MTVFFVVCKVGGSSPDGDKKGALVKLLKLPMLVTLLFIGVMYVIGNLMNSLKYHFSFQLEISVFIFLVGVVVVLAGGYSFKKANTTVSPIAPEKATKLVTSGVYAISRNPMYVGFLLCLIAVAVSIGSLVNTVLVIMYILIVNRFYISREERALENLFGREYERYKRSVRRWV